MWSVIHQPTWTTSTTSSVRKPTKSALLGSRRNAVIAFSSCRTCSRFLDARKRPREGVRETVEIGELVRERQEADFERGRRERDTPLEQRVKELAVNRGRARVEGFGRSRRLVREPRDPEDRARAHERRGHGTFREHGLDALGERVAQRLQ